MGLSNVFSSLRRLWTLPAKPARNYSRLLVEALEERTLLTVSPGFEWSMADRFGLDQGNFVYSGSNRAAWERVLPTYLVNVLDRPDGRIDLWNDPAFVRADQFTVNFDAGPSTADSAIRSYRWAVFGDGPDGQESHAWTSTGPRSSIELPQGTFYVSLTVDAAEGSVTRTEAIRVRDILVVSIGDSAASGEGNPESPRNDDRGALWADSPNAAQAHRSTLSAPARAALELERSDPHTSVTFVDVSASGQGIDAGLLGAGVWQEPTDEAHAGSPAQLDLVKDIVGQRRIDTLLVTAGANDLDWSGLMRQLIINGTHSYDELDRLHDLSETFANALPGKYDQLARRIETTLNPGRVVINEYFDMTRDANGNFAAMLGEIVPADFDHFEIDATEARWLHDRVLVPLNEAIHAAAGRHQSLGWQVVDGIDEAFRTHGYAAGNQRWVVTADQSRETQGPYNTPSPLDRVVATAGSILGAAALGIPAAGLGSAFLANLGLDQAFRIRDIITPTSGMMHPNARGQQEIANRMLDVLNRSPNRIDGFGTNAVTVTASDPRSDGDHIVVRQSLYSFGFVEVLINGEIVLAQRGGVGQTLTIQAGNGSNIVDVQGIPAGLSVTLIGGNSNDTFRVGTRIGTAADSLSRLLGQLRVEGGGGRDSIAFNDDGSTIARTYTLMNTGNGSTLERTGAATTTYNGVETVTLNAGSGGNTVNIRRTLYAADTFVNTGNGGDTINVGDVGYLYWVGRLTIDGQGGTDRLTFENSSDSQARTYELHRNPTHNTLDISGWGGDGFDYIGVETVTLNAGFGGNTVNIHRTNYDGAMIVNTGNGTDTITVGDVGYLYWAGALTINAQGSIVDSLTFGNDSDSTGRTYTLGRNGIYDTMSLNWGGEGFSYTGAEAVTLDAGFGGNTINLHRSNASGSMVVNSGNGNDTINVGDGGYLYWADRLVINGQGGVDRLAFDNTADTQGWGYALDVDGDGARHTASYGLPSNGPFARQTTSYLGVETLTLNAGTSNDVVTVSAMPSSLQTFINAGGGSDTLQGPNRTNVWYMTGPAAGGLNLASTGLTFLTGLSFEAVERLVGGSAGDTLYYSSNASSRSVTVNLTQGAATDLTSGIAGFENVTGGSGDDRLTGNSADNVLLGGGGNDTLTGGAGSDTLDGGAGNDTYVFATTTTVETDTIIELANGGTDTLSFAGLTTPVTVNLNTGARSVGSHVNRTLLVGANGQAANLENITGGSAADILTGNASANALVGGAGNDTLVGGTNIDTLTGGAGNDNLNGGGGNDTFVFAAASVAETDTVIELANNGTDTLTFSTVTAAVTVDLSSATTSLGSHTNRTLLVGTAGQAANLENVTGGTGDDLIVGNALANILNGGAGNDILVGGAGADTLIGAAGRDLLIGGAGADTLTGGIGEDILIGGSTNFDANAAALRSLMAEWASTRTFEQRVANLTGVGTGTWLNSTNYLLPNYGSRNAGTRGTVIDDSVSVTVTDILTGGDTAIADADRDWFFAFSDNIRDFDSLRNELLH